MEELQKKIIGNWFEIRENFENPVHLREHFNLTSGQLQETAKKLKISVEEGIIEYKKTVLSGCFKLARALKYDTGSLRGINEVSSGLNSLLYTILFQRLLAKKIIKPKPRGVLNEEETDDRIKPEKETSHSLAEIGSIVKEIQEFVKTNPRLKNNKHIINIFIQVNKYRKELENMKKILPNIPADKLENTKANYSALFNDIFSKLINSYRQFSLEHSGREPEKKPAHPLDLYDLTRTSEILKNQAEIVLKIKTTFDFMEKERYKVLDYVQFILSLEKKLYELIESENKYYYNLALSDSGKRELSRTICLELMKIIERQAETAA